MPCARLVFASLLPVLSVLGAITAIAEVRSDSLRVRPDVILDTQGFGFPMAAATLFVPDGWTREGGVAWGNQHSCTNGYGLNWRATSPDGASGIAVLPHQGWEWNSTGGAMKHGCQLLQIDSAESYLRAIVRETMPTARVLKVRRRPDIEALDAGAAGVTDDGFQRITKTLSAAQIFVAHELDGRPVEGSIIASVLITHIRTGGGVYGSPIDSWSGYAGSAFASWGPAEQYDAGLFEAIRASYLPAPLWSRKIAGHNTRMDQIAIQGLIERGKIWRNTAAEINQIINETWANQQQSADYRAREFLEMIRDVETYSDADAPGGTVELSSFYDQAWKLEDGTYVLTSDPSFNPYQVFGVDGQQLVAAP